MTHLDKTKPNLYITKSVFVLAEILVMTPWKLFILLLAKVMIALQYPENVLFYLGKKSTDNERFWMLITPLDLVR